MELRHLRYLQAVVEEASFTRAAAKLHIAQPGLSAQIRQLEEELGQTLLDRSGRAIRPTKIGEAVLGCARTALDAVDSVRRVVDEFAGLIRGKIAIGMINGCSLANFAELLAEFHAQYPQVEITLSEANSDFLLKSLSDGRLDVAIVGLAGQLPPEIKTQLIVDEPIVLSVNHNDPWAAKDAVKVKSLAERPLITLPRGTGLRACIDDACAAQGFQPRVLLEATSPGMLVKLAALGLGAAILPQSVARDHSRDLRSIRLTHPNLRGRLALAWRAAETTLPAVREFVRRARAAIPIAKLLTGQLASRGGMGSNKLPALPSGAA